MYVSLYKRRYPIKKEKRHSKDVHICPLSISPVFHLVEKLSEYQNLQSKQLNDVIGFIYGITLFYRMINSTYYINEWVN